MWVGPRAVSAGARRLRDARALVKALTLARVRQWPERSIAVWGEAWYGRILARHRRPVYQALGTLEGVPWRCCASAGA